MSDYLELASFCRFCRQFYFFEVIFVQKNLLYNDVMSSKLKAVFLDAGTIGNVTAFAKLQELTDLVCYRNTPARLTPYRLTDADVVITNKVVLHKSTLKNAPQLKLICVAATGTNNVDLEAAQSQNIPVKNVEGYSTFSVVQHTFAMLLRLTENLTYYDQYVKSGDYANSRSFTNVKQPYRHLAGKTFGIIGLGTIGRQVAAVAEAFGAKVVYYSTSGQNDNDQYKRLNLKELLAQADVVSVHAPLNEQTQNLLHYDNLKTMKPDAFLLNTGRGGIVAEADLARIIDEEKIAGAGIDVFEKEPMLKENPLLKVKNSNRLVLTPHIAWASQQAREALLEGIIKNIKDFMNEPE